MEPNVLDKKTALPSGKTETAAETLERSRKMMETLSQSASQSANTVNAADLGTQPYQTPPPATETGYTGLIASSEAAITDLTPEVEKGKEAIQGKYDRLGALESERAAGYESEGVYDKQLNYKNLVNTINKKELAYQSRVDKIRNENPTGQLEGGQQIQIDKLSKDWAIEKAALSISAAFAKDDYTTAKAIVDDRVNAETEGLKNELAGLEFFYTQNYNQLSDERKNLLEFQMQQVAEEKAEREDLMKEIGAVQLEAAANGAPASVITAIGQSEELTDAINSAGAYIGLLDRQREARLGSGGGGSDSDGDGIIDITPEDERTLTGAGFSSEDIKDLQKSVAEFGVEATLAAIDDPVKQAAVRDIYNVAAKVTRGQIEATVSQKIAQEALLDAFTEDELTEIARAQGAGTRKWWFDKNDADTRTEFLKSDAAREYYIQTLVDQYKAAGMFQEEPEIGR